MKGQGQHGMLPENTHDESSAQMFVQSMKLHLARQVSPHLRTVYEARVKPTLTKELGRAPRDRHDVRKGMQRDLAYQMWSSLQRTSQELKQETQTQIAFRQIDTLVDRAKRLKKRAKGSLRVDPKLKMPRYVTAVDIHIIPGGYHNELKADDVLPAAVYDPGVFLYSMGRMGAFNEDMGATLISHLKQKYPQFRPRRILDLGCSVGHSTIPYAAAYPEAEIHALDISAPMVRYAHARATSLGKAIHFSQQNAEHTDYPDATFDLVVSHILLHETAHAALRNIFKECQRLLKPGGLMVHCETPLYAGMDPYDQFILDWDTYNNNEPFWGSLKDLDLKAICTESGFRPQSYFATAQPSAVGAEYAKGRTKLFQGGDFGGAGAWFLVGAQK
ncbi:MAG: class I SAM-dependent methyltransferase [Alphaproteobacteria bacterium]|nr:class I SAM-dependent methyltransferase [Alphaproteobacteria bacterium]